MVDVRWSPNICHAFTLKAGVFSLFADMVDVCRCPNICLAFTFRLTILVFCWTSDFLVLFSLSCSQSWCLVMSQCQSCFRIQTCELAIFWKSNLFLLILPSGWQWWCLGPIVTMCIEIREATLPNNSLAFIRWSLGIWHAPDLPLYRSELPLCSLIGQCGWLNISFTFSIFYTI